MDASDRDMPSFRSSAGIAICDWWKLPCSVLLANERLACLSPLPQIRYLTALTVCTPPREVSVEKHREGDVRESSYYLGAFLFCLLLSFTFLFSLLRLDLSIHHGEGIQQ
jgi:hypothetical protein